jgi:hypothetical protein
MTSPKWMAMFLTVLTMLLIPVLVLAQTIGDPSPCPPVTVSMEPVIQEWWEVLLSHLVEVVASLCMVILPILIRAAINRWTKKLDADKQLAIQRLIDGILSGAVAFAEEQAKKALDAGQEKTPSAQKLDTALSYARDQIVASGVGEVSREQLEKWLEARLHMQRGKMAAVEVAERRLES